MRGADHRGTAAHFLRAALRASGLHEAVDLDTRRCAPWRGRRRRDGRISLCAGAAARERFAGAYDGISAGGSGVRNHLPELTGCPPGQEKIVSFDISRNTFNPRKGYSGVVMQQGRVQLDADWNEWLAELSRRMQAGTLDVLGRAVYPPTTPYAFKITGASPGGAN